MREILTSPRLPAAAFRYSAMIKCGSLYQMAGQIGINIDSGKLVSGGTYAETRTILHNMQASLPDFGLTLDSLMHATIFCACFEEFHLVNRAWEEVFATITPPTRSSVGVTHLPLNACVEIEFRFYQVTTRFARGDSLPLSSSTRGRQ